MGSSTRVGHTRWRAREGVEHLFEDGIYLERRDQPLCHRPASERPSSYTIDPSSPPVPSSTLCVAILWKACDETTDKLPMHPCVFHSESLRSEAIRRRLRLGFLYVSDRDERERQDWTHQSGGLRRGGPRERRIVVTAMCTQKRMLERAKVDIKRWLAASFS